MATVSKINALPEHPVSADPTNSCTLPARYYYEPHIFAREREEIFFRSWLYVGHETELPHPGSYLTASVFDQNLFLIRGQDSLIRAFYNVCSHRAHAIVEGHGTRGPVIQCPYHAWCYNIDGSLKAARGTDDMPDFDLKHFGLTEVRSDSVLGFLFVNLDPGACTLREYLPGFEEEVRADVAQRQDLVLRTDSEGLALPGEVMCNWKVLVENFQECYHCRPAHKALSTLFDVDNYQTVCHQNYTSAIVPHTRKWDNAAYPITESDAQQIGRFWFIWPNLSFTAIPGTPNISIYRIDPVSPEVTGNWTQAFRLPDDDSETNDKRSHWGANVAGVEDKDLCESVQRGLHQRSYNQSRFVYSSGVNPLQGGGEIGVHWHSRKVAETLGV